MVEWDHIVNQYPFLWQQGRLFQTYGAIGASWSYATYSQVGLKHSRWLYLALYVVSQSVLLLCLSFYLSTTITTICSFLAAYMLAGLTMVSFDRATSQESTAAQKSTSVMMLLTFTAAFTMSLIGVFEAFYYTNRDVKYWTLINNSAVPGTCLVASILLI